MEDVDDTKSVRGSDSYGFTREQYTQLVNLLQASNTSNAASSSKVNIASGHVTS
ncbi:hypothetical protein A2U01_0115964, partial [Trifolium medium]|nr:hypothetical protein [Trifolium medium]